MYVFKNKIYIYIIHNKYKYFMFHLKTEFKNNKLYERNNCTEFGVDNIKFCTEFNAPHESIKALKVSDFLRRFYRSEPEVVI